MARSAAAVVVLADDQGETALYGCLRSIGTRVEIQDLLDDSIDVGRVRLAGDWVAFTTEETCPACSEESFAITATNLRTTREYAVPAYLTVTPTDLVVNRRGSTAWISPGRVYKCERGPYLGKRHGKSTLIDRGSGIDDGSLELRGRTLNWRDGRTRRSATLR